MTQASTRTDPLTLAVLGGGVVAMTFVQQITDMIDSGHIPNGRVVWLIHQHAWEGGGASESGGWFSVFSCDDPRAPRWASRSLPWWREFRVRHPHLAPMIEDTPTVLLSHLSRPVIPAGHPGRATEIDSASWGFSQPHAIEMDSGMVINTSAFLPAWQKHLEQHPAVQVVLLPEHVTGPAQAADIANLYQVDITYVAIGLGAMSWGDEQLEPRFGWLLRGPLAPGLPTTHTLMLDDDDLRCVYCIPRRTPGFEHAVYGGIVTHLDELADWQVARNDAATKAEVLKIAQRLATEGRERAMEEIPLLRPALQDHTKLELWASFRPYRHTVFADQVDPSTSLGQRMWMLHGMGGSGWTITPAAVAEVITKSLGDLPEPPSNSRSGVTAG